MKDEFEVVQLLLKSRSSAMSAPRIVSGPTLRTGICFCAACSLAMTLRTGKDGRYRYYTCCTKARRGETGCPGRTVPVEKLDNLVAEYIEQRLLAPNLPWKWRRFPLGLFRWRSPMGVGLKQTTMVQFDRQQARRNYA